MPVSPNERVRRGGGGGGGWWKIKGKTGKERWNFDVSFNKQGNVGKREEDGSSGFAGVLHAAIAIRAMRSVFHETSFLARRAIGPKNPSNCGVP